MKTYTKYTEITPKEALQALADNNGEPVEGFAFLDLNHDTWTTPSLRLAGYFRRYYLDQDDYHWDECARVEEVDPRQVPESCKPLPEPWLAHVPWDLIIEKGLKNECDNAVWFYDYSEWDGGGNYGLNLKEEPYAIDVRTDFAKEHFPEIVACYDPSEWEVDPFEELVRRHEEKTVNWKYQLREAYELGQKNGAMVSIDPSASVAFKNCTITGK